MSTTDRNDERLDALHARVERLEAELAALKAEVVALSAVAASDHGHPVREQRAQVEDRSGSGDAVTVSAGRHMSDGPRSTGVASVTRHSTPAEKIALFRARFCGRGDVYALPWVSRKTGRKGWSPAVRGGYSTDRDTDRDFLPLTDGVLAAHLRGDVAGRRECHVGLYPVRVDDTCCLLACDFDDGGWQADAAAYADACRGAGIDVLAEISRSGEGAHVWMFFDAPVPAASARAVGTAMLREASARRAALRLDSYDRLFPAQDTLPTRSPGRQRLGNLIALPLYGRARAANRCVFADVHTWVPYDDQFAALAAVRPVPAAAVFAIAQAPAAGPAAGPELPLRPRRGALRVARADVAGRHIAVTRDAVVHVPIAGMPAIVVSALKHAACLSNPEFYRKQAQRFSTFGTPRLVICFEQDTTELRLRAQAKPSSPVH